MENSDPKLKASETGCGKFVVADEFLDQYARCCGWKGLVVYIALCRHANKDRQCFPSIEQMAKKLGIAVNSVKRGLGELQKWKIIKVEKTKWGKGTWKNNVYSLLEPSQWHSIPAMTESCKQEHLSPTMTNPQPPQRLDHGPVVTEPQPPQRLDHSPVGPTKDAHLEGYTSKETHKEGFKREDSEKRVIPYQQAGVHNLSTPAGMMRNLIAAFKAKDARYANLLQQLKSKGIPAEIATSELAKFYNYWTELNSLGTQQRWEMEKTFEISKRLVIWLSNCQRFKPQERAKKGVVIT